MPDDDATDVEERDHVAGEEPVIMKHPWPLYELKLLAGWDHSMLLIIQC